MRQNKGGINHFSKVEKQWFTHFFDPKMIYKPHFWTFQDICDFLKIYINNIWKFVFGILNNFVWDLSYGYNNRDSDSTGTASH